MQCRTSVAAQGLSSMPRYNPSPKCQLHNLEFVFKVSTLQSPVIQMYSKFPEKQKGVTADLRCCHILSSMEEGVDLEAWIHTLLRCDLEHFNNTTNMMPKSSRFYLFIFYFLCLQAKHGMKLSFLVSCINLLKFLQYHYGDFQIQIFSVPV